eukprot:750010-Hanusia_phi.AAC.4
MHLVRREGYPLLLLVNQYHGTQALQAEQQAPSAYASHRSVHVAAFSLVGGPAGHRSRLAAPCPGMVTVTAAAAAARPG